MTFKPDVLTESPLPDLTYRGKVRDTHDVDPDTLLMVSTDRISAYDVVIPTPIPGKGAVLNQLSLFWFDKTKHICGNHLINSATENIALPETVRRRGMYVRKADRIDIECVARGYITGSAMAEYELTGMVAGETIKPGMVEADAFPTPIFTPATKAEEGHDENISISQMENLIGSDLTERLKNLTLELYDFSHNFALTKGIIIADTKLEFGFIDGQLTLIDEILTPDSSRFWDATKYQPGKSQANFDKQFVRNWLTEQDWNREPPAPPLPEKIVSRTSMRYEEAFSKLTGSTLQ